MTLHINILMIQSKEAALATNLNHRRTTPQTLPRYYQLTNSTERNFIALQERAARTPAPQGHTFAKSKVTGNDRAVQGNVHSGKNIHILIHIPGSVYTFDETVVEG